MFLQHMLPILALSITLTCAVPIPLTTKSPAPEEFINNKRQFQMIMPDTIMQGYENCRLLINHLFRAHMQFTDLFQRPRKCIQEGFAESTTDVATPILMMGFDFKRIGDRIIQAHPNGASGMQAFKELWRSFVSDQKLRTNVAAVIKPFKELPRIAASCIRKTQSKYLSG